MTNKNAETMRLGSANEKKEAWKKWGPYLSERQWGTVREDFSEDGNAWEHFHGNNGAGLGASHQTGWTGIIARAVHLFATTPPERALEVGKGTTFAEAKQAVSS